MHRLTRRDFLRLGAGAVVALGAPQILAGCGGEEAAPKPTSTLEPTARVAAIRGNDLYTMAREALEAVGGAQAIVNPGETVFIKPNMVTLPFAPALGNRFVVGECTKPEIVIAVAEECLRAGAAEVIIGDGAQMPRFDWEYATTLDGSTNLAAEAERLSSAYEVLKTHEWAQLTLSLKNFLGITPLERYGWKGADSMYSRILLHKNDFTPEAIAQLYLDIVEAVRPDLAIIDASICVEGNGPTTGGEKGLTVDMKDRLGSWLLLASTDLVAADATAARIINHDVAYVDRILAMGYEMGLGEVREDSIEIIGERLDNLRVGWKPAKLAISDFLEGQ
jgi:uncharacterized protein (DUF362 family)